MGVRLRYEADRGLYHELVAIRMRQAFEERRIRAADVARALGWTDMYLSRRITGKTPFGLDDVAAVAGLLEVPVAALLPEPDGAAPGVTMDRLSPKLALNPLPAWIFLTGRPEIRLPADPRAA